MGLGAVFVLLSILASYLAARSFYRPVRLTLDSMPDSGPDGAGTDEFQRIRRTLEELASRNRTLKGELDFHSLEQRQNLLLDLLNGRQTLSSDDPGPQGITMIGENLHLVLASFRQTENDADALLHQAIGLAEDQLRHFDSSAQVWPVIVNSHTLAFIINHDGGSWEQAFRELKTTFDKLRPPACLLSHSAAFNTAEELPAYFDALQLPFYLNELVDNSTESLFPDIIIQRSGPGLSFWDKHELQQTISDGNTERTVSLVRSSLVEALRGAGTSRNDIHQFFAVIYSFIWDRISHNGWNREDVWSAESYSFATILTSHSVVQLLAALEGFLRHATHFIAVNKGQRELSLIAECRSIMADDCCKPIGLSNVAERLHISAPYLSRVFKRETGINFLQYLLRLRIEKSKEFLKTGMTLQHIAQEVQMGNAQNFIRIFRKFVGTTPGAYRNEAKN